jgi:hypothetical protein
MRHLVAILILGGCVSHAPCKPHTVLVKLRFDAASAAADQLTVGLALADGMSAQPTATHQPGQMDTTLEIDFTDGYPVGAQLTVTITATLTGTVIGGGSNTGPLTAGCTSGFEVDVNSSDVDLSSLESSSAGDLSGADSSVADLSSADLTHGPACATSATCPANFPVCDATLQACRECNASADDQLACEQRSATTKYCKLSGTNAGMCAECNTNADCPTATPTCNPDGTCRPCATNADCGTLICNGSDGTCVPLSDIVYVDASNDAGQTTCSETGKDGSFGRPYCLIADALTLISVSTRHYVHLAGSTNTYAGFAIPSTNGTLTFIGPGKNAATPATIQAATNMNAFLINPGAKSATVVLDGLTLVGNGNAPVVATSGGSLSSPNCALTVVDSSISTGTNDGILVTHCQATILRSVVSGTNVGLHIGANADEYFVVQNCFLINNQTGADLETANGSFTFNTVANNTGTLGIYCAVANTAIADSIVFGNKKVSNSQFETGAGGSCNLISTVTGTDTAPGAIQLAPVFVSATDAHLDLTAGANLSANQACCIDHAIGPGPTPTPSPMPTVDIDGNTRPRAAGWDIGAHEAM